MMNDANNPQQERDAPLSATYRAGADEMPPPALDDAIRAAARRAVGARPQAAGAGLVRRWQMPLSMAAVLVLCVSLVAVMRDEGGALTEAPRADAPAGNAARAVESIPKIELAPATPASKSLGLKLPGLQSPSADAAGRLGEPGSRLGASGDVDDNRAAKRQAETANAGAATGLRAPAAAKSDTLAATGALRETARAENSVLPAELNAGARDRMAMEQRPVNGPMAAAESARQPMAAPPARADREERSAAVVEAQAPAPARPAVARAAPAAPAANAVAGYGQAKTAPAEAAAMQDSLAKDAPDSVEALSRLAPDRWLARIEELRRQGRLDAARAGLAAFRKRYPDYALPASLRDWAQP